MDIVTSTCQHRKYQNQLRAVDPDICCDYCSDSACLQDITCNKDKSLMALSDELLLNTSCFEILFELLSRTPFFIVEVADNVTMLEQGNTC